MANKYLLSSQPDGSPIITYYTANSSGDLVSIGTTYNMTQGFSDTELALLDNDDYSRLQNGKLWIESDASSYTVSTTTLGYGIIKSTTDTCINLEGYSGINSINIDGIGGLIALSFDSGATWVSRILNETIQLYEWQTIAESEISTKGMTQAVLESLSFDDFSSIFQRTQLDFMIYLSGTDSINNITVSLPPNGAPVIKNFSSDQSSFHEGNVVITCDIIDAEGEQPNYKVYFNGDLHTDTTDVPVDGHISITFPDTMFTVGTNAVKIVSTDPRGASSENTIYITRVNTAPKLTGILNGNIYNLNIEDAEGDKVKYKIIFNGTEVVPYTDLLGSPYNFTYEIDKRSIIYNQMNTLIIEVQDEIGTTSLIEEQFVGTYYGLLFSNPDDSSYYSSDVGDVLTKLNFGSLVANQTSTNKQIMITNKSAYGLAGVTVDIDQVIGQNVYPELSLDNAEYSGNSIDLGVMTQNESKPVYVRIRTDKTSYGGGDFKIRVSGTSI